MILSRLQFHVKLLFGRCYFQVVVCKYLRPFNVGGSQASVAQVENTFHSNSFSLTQFISLAISLTQIIKFLPSKGKHSLTKLSLY